VLSHDDIRYVQREFVPLEDLCRRAGRDVDEVRRLIVDRELPAPPYPGLEHVPEDYFELPDAERFAAEYSGPDAAENLAAYLEGAYFVCLRQATPENIVRKEELVVRLRMRLANPHLGDVMWREAVRAEVDELDRLERPFSPNYDRERFGVPPTRDELVEAPRRLWPDLFAPGVAATG
jgi:hypothetical protein